MIEAIRYIAFNDPGRASPVVVDFPKGGTAPSSFTEAVGVIAELHVEIRVQDHAYHLGE
jgi:hypothetical protein